MGKNTINSEIQEDIKELRDELYSILDDEIGKKDIFNESNVSLNNEK